LAENLKRPFKNESEQAEKSAIAFGIDFRAKLWRRINGLQKHIIHHTASKIIKFAEKVHADVIVFEYLGKMKMPKRIYGAKKLCQKFTPLAQNRDPT
jgi:putative transposase